MLFSRARSAPGSRATLARRDGDGEDRVAVHAPLSCEIVEVNPAVLADVTLIEREPYAAGWMFRVARRRWPGKARACSTPRPMRSGSRAAGREDGRRRSTAAVDRRRPAARW